MNQAENRIELNEILSEMSKQENRDALLLIVERLPEISKTVKSLEELTMFANSTISDKQSLGEIFDQAEKKFETFGLSGQTLESLIQLTKILPQVVLLLQNTLEGIQFVSGVLKDQESVQFLTGELEPVIGKVQGTAALFAETNKRCAADSDLPTISIFKLVSLLKDENIRKGYKYLQTFLAVLSEKNSRGNG